MVKEVKNLQAFLSAKHQKEEMSSRRVELSLFDDINNLEDKAFNQYDVQSFLIKAEQSVEKSLMTYKQALDKTSEAMSKAKDLGASDFVDGLNRKESELKEGFKRANKLLSAISSAIKMV